MENNNTTLAVNNNLVDDNAETLYTVGEMLEENLRRGRIDVEYLRSTLHMIR